MTNLTIRFPWGHYLHILCHQICFLNSGSILKPAKAILLFISIFLSKLFLFPFTKILSFYFSRKKIYSSLSPTILLKCYSKICTQKMIFENSTSLHHVTLIGKCRILLYIKNTIHYF